MALLGSARLGAPRFCSASATVLFDSVLNVTVRSDCSKQQFEVNGGFHFAWRLCILLTLTPRMDILGYTLYICNIMFVIRGWELQGFSELRASQGARKHCAGALRNHLGVRKQCTSHLASRKHCTGVLKSHLGTRETLHGCAQEPLGRSQTLHRRAQEPPGRAKSLHRFAQEPLGRSKTSHRCAQKPLGRPKTLHRCAQEPPGCSKTQKLSKQLFKKSVQESCLKATALYSTSLCSPQL